MAKQTGPYGFRGKIDGVVGKRVKGKLYLSKPGGFTPESWQQNDAPDYAPRKEANDFGTNARAAKQVFNICDQDIALSNRDSTAYKRLVSHFQKFRHFDRDNPQGSKRPSPAAFYHLRNFNYNVHSSSLELIMPEPIIEDDHLTYQFKGFKDLQGWPTSANRVEFFGYSVQVDFETLACTNRLSSYLSKPYSELYEDLEFTIPLHRYNCLSLAGIRFFDEVANYPQPLFNKAISPFKILFFRE